MDARETRAKIFSTFVQCVAYVYFWPLKIKAFGSFNVPEFILANLQS